MTDTPKTPRQVYREALDRLEAAVRARGRMLTPTEMREIQNATDDLVDAHDAQREGSDAGI